MSNNDLTSIPIIDIFAGPGGLGEGFSAFKKTEGAFRIKLSIEKDNVAHQTLRLRSFFRQFPVGQAPEDYYDFVKGKISIDQLYENWPEEAHAANTEAWCGTLGDPDERDKNAVSDDEVDARIRRVLQNSTNWVLIGGPPCQAYSIAGRSRRQETLLDEKKDKRVGLYKQYLRILAVHSPAVFVMENVKGILSARTDENSVFSNILRDLSDPSHSYFSSEHQSEKPLAVCPGYKIYSLTTSPQSDVFNNLFYKETDFTIRAEEYGVPQARHRVILLGVRNDIFSSPRLLKPSEQIPISQVLDGLPKLRSGLSKGVNTFDEWKRIISDSIDFEFNDQALTNEVRDIIKNIENPHFETGGNYLEYSNVSIKYQPEWFLDSRLHGVLNHSSKSHMESDIHRYLFVATYGKLKNISPQLDKFPKSLLPSHVNVQQGIDGRKFSDRFRVQLWNKPSKTITSHISKDGHYYIHPDPAQCRSLSVREAARIQTFPDNYFFCGQKTAQFHQVGNAVPPYLAYQIAAVVYEILNPILSASSPKRL